MTPEFIPGLLDGTVHRLDNGHRTGVMWGPSVEGNWYASRSQVADGETFKFTEWKFADLFLRADIGPSGRVFSGHMHYSYRMGDYTHFLWYHDQEEASRSAGNNKHEIIAEPCDGNTCQIADTSPAGAPPVTPIN